MTADVWIAPAYEWNEWRGYYEQWPATSLNESRTREGRYDAKYRGAEPGPDLDRLRRPACGHVFGPFLRCYGCGADWHLIQITQEPCREADKTIAIHPLPALCRQNRVTIKSIASRARVSDRTVQTVFATLSGTGIRTQARMSEATRMRVLEIAHDMLAAKGVEVPPTDGAPEIREAD